MRQHQRGIPAIPSRPSRARAAARLLLLCAGLGTFAFALRQADVDRTLALLGALGGFAALALVPQGVWTVLHAGAWQRLLAILGHRVALPPLSADFLSAEATRLTLPAGPAFGESLAVYLLHRSHGVPVPDGVASLAIKKLLVLGTNAVYAALALVLGYQVIVSAHIGPLSGSAMWWLLAGATLSLVAMAAALGLSMRSRALAEGARRLLLLLPIASLRRALDARVERFRRADRQLARPLEAEHLPALAAPAALLLLQWLLEAFETWLLLYLLGVPLNPATVLAIEVSASLLRSMAFAVPAGLGVQDLGYLAMFGAFGVPEAASVAAAFVVLKRGKELFWIGAGYLALLVRRAQPVVGCSAEVDRA